MTGEEFTIRHTSQVIYIILPGDVKAYLKYHVEENTMKLIETYTPPEFRGMGIASKLVEYAVNLAHENNWLIEPICSYAIYYFMKNKEKRELLIEKYRDMKEDDWKQLFEHAKIRERREK